MTRPIWALMNKLPQFKSSPAGDLVNSEWLEQRVINLPAVVCLEDIEVEKGCCFYKY